MIIRHRINRIEELRRVPKKYGVEIDVRGYGKDMLLNHDAIDNPQNYDTLENYLKECGGRFVIFNMKEAGYEKKVIELAEKHGVKDYFLLDVEFPYIYRATRKEGFRKIAVRYSEAEPIEMIEAQKEKGKPLVDWVWIDTNTRLPLDEGIVEKLKGFRTCLVCPERWGRPEDIPRYIERVKSLGFKLDAVMTSEKYQKQWEESGVLI